MSVRHVAVELAPVWRASTGSARDDRDTEALEGEPLDLTGEERDGRLGVVAPWQPSSLDERGYPGWVSAEQVGAEKGEVGSLHLPGGTFPRGLEDPITLARGLLGTPYVWGGLSARGIDCSGLVHLVHRWLGTVVPRDARDQASALASVPVDEVRRGDLYFFARPERPVHHVALVVEPGVIVHASHRDGGVVEGPLAASGRSASLVTAGRVRPGPTMTR
jgi:hypothetical protein